MFSVSKYGTKIEVVFISISVQNRKNIKKKLYKK